MEPTPPAPPQAESTPPASTLFHTWQGEAGKDIAHHMAVAGDGKLVTLTGLSAKKFNGILDNLRNAKLASDLEAQKGARSIELAAIQSIELTPVFKQLRVTHAEPDGRTRQLKLTAAHAQDLQPLSDPLARLTKGPLEVQPLTAWVAIREPLGAIVFTLLIGVFATWGATQAHPNYEPTGTRTGTKRLLNWLGLWLGPWGVGAIVAVCVLAEACWLYRRLTVRPTKSVIRLS